MGHGTLIGPEDGPAGPAVQPARNIVWAVSTFSGIEGSWGAEEGGLSQDETALHVT